MDVNVTGSVDGPGGITLFGHDSGGIDVTATRSYDGGHDVPEITIDAPARRRPDRRPHPLTRDHRRHTMTTIDTQETGGAVKRSGRHPSTSATS